jgi:hypothetical protein
LQHNQGESGSRPDIAKLSRMTRSGPFPHSFKI